jgi:hypothetical protein
MRVGAYNVEVRQLWLLAVLGCGRFDFGSVQAHANDAASIDSPVDAPLDPTLVAWWRMESLEGSGSTRGILDATDLSQTFAACTEGSNCPTIVPGKIGNAAQFDGSTTILSAASAPALIDPVFTIGAWFRIGVVNNAGACVMTKGLGTDISNSWAACLDNASVPYFFTCQAAGCDSLQATQPITDNGWHYIACTWTGTTKNLWLDGVSVALDSPAGIDFDDDPIYIGADVDSGVPVTNLDGLVDEVRIYNRVLSEAEIIALSMP